MSSGTRGSELFLTADDIALRVTELGKEISLTYGATGLTAVGVLKGALVFLADLIRCIDSPTTVEFLRAASYHDGTAPAGPPQVTGTDELDLRGRHVLLVDDIVDTGHTLQQLQGCILGQQPASLRTCVLLDKRARREVDVTVDWAGFSVPDRFVVGYGLDHAEAHRGLPYLTFLNPPAGND